MLPVKADFSPLMWLQEYMNISPYLTKVASKERRTASKRYLLSRIGLKVLLCGWC